MNAPECCTKYADHVFVYGSNLAARNGKGAALHAKLFHGAMNVSSGPSGARAYAIPTKSARLQPLSLAEIRPFMRQFVLHATAHPERRFYVTAVGTGLAGHSPGDIAPMFADAPENCVLPEGWRT